MQRFTLPGEDDPEPVSDQGMEEVKMHFNADEPEIVRADTIATEIHVEDLD